MVRASKYEMEDYHEAQQLDKRRHNVNTDAVDRENRWKKPNANSVKVNWDAAIDKKARKMGTLQLMLQTMLVGKKDQPLVMKSHSTTKNLSANLTFCGNFLLPQISLSYRPLKSQS